MNVYDFAMKMETDAEAFYRKISAESAVEGIGKIFLDLAADEQKHYAIFSEMKAKGGPAAMEDSQALERARNVFEGMLKDKAKLGPVKGDLEAYRFALKLEAKGGRFYEEMAEKEKDLKTQKLLRKVAQEEFKHFTIIQNVYDFVNAPNQYLAWGEFSNVEEFRNFGREVD